MGIFNYYYRRLIEVLENLHSPREAVNIAKIYFEDRFGIVDLDNTSHTKIEDRLFNDDINRFRNGEPVQYIVGKVFFYNSFFKVTPAVLIPRPETELLVYEALKAIDKKDTKILDIGTGSGCIALSIAKERPTSIVTALDISNEALKIARGNAKSLEIHNAQFKKIDFLDKTAWSELEKYNLIISNPPYIKKSEKELMSKSTLKFEPGQALFPENEDYLIFYKTILDFAGSHLQKGGQILCELNEFSKDDIIEVLSKYDYRWEILDDLDGKPRILHIL